MTINQNATWRQNNLSHLHRKRFQTMAPAARQDGVGAKKESFRQCAESFRFFLPSWNSEPRPVQSNQTKWEAYSRRTQHWHHLSYISCWNG